MATNCAITWHNLGGVWSANNFSKFKLRNQNTFVKRKCKKTSNIWHLCLLMKFQIISSSPSSKIGGHSLLLCAVGVGKRIGNFVWNCLGRPLSCYGQFHSRLLKLYGALAAVEVINLLLQKLPSNLCGLLLFVSSTLFAQKTLQHLQAKT